MATFTAIKNKNQTPKDMIRTMLYMMDDKKTVVGGVNLNSGVNCNVYSSYLEMRTTKQQYRKTDKRQFYQFVQSFPEDTRLSPEEVHRLGVEFAEKQFGDFECLVSTHCNTENLHNHILVNSVSYKDGKKLHQNHDVLMEHRRVNDAICLRHGEEILPKYDNKKKYQNIKTGEYRAGLQGKSWKFDLINEIEDALLYSTDRESFIKNMAYEGYSELSFIGR